MSSHNPALAVKVRDLIVTRVFSAPVALVWKAWSDPKLVMQWWGPDHFSCPSAEMDFREGGTSLVCMRAPTEFGTPDTYSSWTYQKIVPMELIEFIQNLADKDGKRIDPAQVGMPPDFPLDIRTVVTFRAMGDRTELTVTQYGMPDAGSQMGKYAEMGLNQTIDKLAASLRG